MKNNLKIGEIVSNIEIAKIFSVSKQGGMRKSIKNNCLIITSSEINSINKDQWDNDILLYKGMGLYGEQSFKFRQNKILFNSKKTNIRIFLFYED